MMSESELCFFPAIVNFLHLSYVQWKHDIWTRSTLLSYITGLYTQPMYACILICKSLTELVLYFKKYATYNIFEKHAVLTSPIEKNCSLLTDLYPINLMKLYNAKQYCPLPIWFIVKHKFAPFFCDMPDDFFGN